MSKRGQRTIGVATVAAACGVIGAGMAGGCNALLSLDDFKNCPQDVACPGMGGSGGAGGNGGGSGGTAPSCTTPADCPAGGDCATPVCTGGKCGLSAKDDGLACMADAGSGYQCKGGACACPAANQCGAACVDTQTDVMNCGTCGTTCPAGIACEGGKCACPNGGVVCGAACVDTQTDESNCGMCGMACTVTGATCEMGACACPGGGTECSGACVDTQTDAMNCGMCGMACTAPTTECAGGSCVCPGGLTECSGTCVDTDADSKNCGACGHDCLGGGCQGGLCQPVVLASGAGSHLAANGNAVFWFLSGSLWRQDLAGGSPTPIATTTISWIHIALDSANVYWFAPAGGNPFYSVQKVAQGGGTTVSLVSNQSYNTSNGAPSGIAVDNQYVYFAQSDTGTIRKVAVGGGTPATVISGVTSQRHLALDATSLFYTGQNNPYSLPKSGGVATQLATTSCVGSITDFAIDASNVYMSCRGAPNTGSILSVPKTGGSVVTLSAALMAPDRIAIDAEHLYWQDPGDFTINRVPLAGGTRVVLATGQGGSASIAVDATSIYWTNNISSTVMRLAK